MSRSVPSVASFTPFRKGGELKKCMLEQPVEKLMDPQASNFPQRSFIKS